MNQPGTAGSQKVKTRNIRTAESAMPPSTNTCQTCSQGGFDGTETTRCWRYLPDRCADEEDDTDRCPFTAAPNALGHRRPGRSSSRCSTR